MRSSFPATVISMSSRPDRAFPASTRENIKYYKDKKKTKVLTRGIKNGIISDGSKEPVPKTAGTARFNGNASRGASGIVHS